MQFAALMREETVLAHLEREIRRLEGKIQDVRQLSNCIESGKLDARSCEILSLMMELLCETDELRMEWLKKWRSRLVTEKKS